MYKCKPNWVGIAIMEQRQLYSSALLHELALNMIWENEQRWLSVCKVDCIAQQVFKEVLLGDDHALDFRDNYWQYMGKFSSLLYTQAFKSLTSDICVPPAPAPTKEMVKLQQVMIVLFNTYMNSFYLSPTLRINGVFSLTRCTITMQIFSPLFTPIPYSSCFHVPWLLLLRISY